MLSVVLCHCCAFFGGNWFNVLKLNHIVSPLSLISSWLGTFHVSCFTLISGYIYYHVRYEKTGYSTVWIFIKKKAIRLLLPYIAVCMVWILPINIIFYEPSFNTLITNFALGVSPSQNWFLLMLFFVSVISYFVSDYFIKHKAFSVIALLCFFIVGVLGGKYLTNYFQIYTAFRYILFFWIGVFMRHFHLKFHSKYTIFAGCAMVLMNMILFYLYQSDFCTKYTYLITYLCNIWGTIGIFVILQNIASNINCNEGFLHYFKKYNFQIYLFHQQIIYIVLWLLYDEISPYVLVIISFILSTSIACMMGQILKKYRFTKLLFGL